jgi:glycolate oxidase FAD binding subunit
MFKAGGRVVKNVTGYDLARGLCGSWGTLAVATEVTFKVLPKAETETTVVIPDLADVDAVSLMCDAMQQSFEISGAAHLTQSLSSLPIELPGVERTLLRIEGFDASVNARVEHLTRFLSGTKGVEIVTGETSRGLWEWIARIHCHGNLGPVLWRISVPPAQGAIVAADVQERFGRNPECVFAYDWSGGLVWAWLDDDVSGTIPADLGASVIRSAIAASGGGHATLMHGPADKRAAIDVFQPQPPALAALNARLKAQFDPAGILNPGRMVRGA